MYTQIRPQRNWFFKCKQTDGKKIKTFVYYLLSFETFWSFSTVIVFLLRLAEIYISQEISPRRMNKSWFFFGIYVLVNFWSARSHSIFYFSFFYYYSIVYFLGGYDDLDMISTNLEILRVSLLCLYLHYVFALFVPDKS